MNGAWNGLLAGSIGAVVIIVTLSVLGLAISIVELSLGGVFASVGLGLALVALALFAAIPAALGGAVGGMMNRDESMETGRPAA
jgi:hypothetical protein